MDVAETEETVERKRRRRDKLLRLITWAYGEEPYDCHQVMPLASDGVLSENLFLYITTDFLEPTLHVLALFD